MQLQTSLVRWKAKINKGHEPLNKIQFERMHHPFRLDFFYESPLYLDGFQYIEL